MNDSLTGVFFLFLVFFAAVQDVTTVDVVDGVLMGTVISFGFSF